MAKGSNQKTKLLELQKIFEEQTDEQHPMSVQQLILALSRVGIAAERKSIYDDVEALQQFGLDIVVLRGRSNLYYLGERRFQLPELKLLVDAAQSAKFITEKKSGELIRKISALASRHEASVLQRQVYVQGRVKTMNESIYYNVDILQAAMAQDQKIECRYFEWVIDPKAARLFTRRWRREGKAYSISPWSLIWDNENYYLAAFDASAGILKHYRVDKLDGIHILPETREGRATFEALDMAEYTKRTFGMYGGEETDVRLRFHNHLIGVAVDRFGKDVIIHAQGENHFTLTVRAVVSPQFLAWVLGFGDEVKLLSPPHVIAALQDTLRRVEGLYAKEP